MEPSKNAFDIIKHQEGLLAPKEDGLYHAYHGKKDRPGVWTIGYGMTWYPNGKAVREGDKITLDQVNAGIEWHVNRFADILDAHLPKNLINQNQFDALTDFMYNLGEGLLTSTLWKKMLQNPNDPTIYLFSLRKGVPNVDSCEFLRWVRSNGKVVEDLIFRRATEAILYYEGRVDFLGH